jgi:hypothetical protein
MWLEKQATTTISGADATMSRRTGPTLRSLAVWPGVSAFVESDRSRWTPRPDSSAIPCRSVGCPSIGVWSSLKSPVWRTEPCGVSIATAIPSGIECVTWKKRIVNGPTVASPPGTATIGSVRCVT